MKRPPKHLAKPTRTWFASVLQAYDLDETGIEILTLAAELRDRAEDARSLVASQGAIVTDRFGQARENPAAKLERDSKIAFARLMRELGLSVEDDSHRPPRIIGD